MADDLLPYYEEELTWLRKAGAEFAREYPGQAARLLLDGNQSTDPFTERLLEGVAFLAARVHRRLDDDFPEVVEALLNVVYPHYLRPIPSAAIVQFELDPDQGLSKREEVRRGKLLYTRPAGQPAVQCRFQVCYDTDVWPIRVSSAQWMPAHAVAGLPGASEAFAALRIRLEAFPGATLPGLAIPRLRFYIDAESRIAHTLYELLGSKCQTVLVCDPARNSRISPAVLPPRSITTAGWTDNESLLPWPQRSFAGYRLLQEYFSFPEKFLFIDVGNLAGAWHPKLTTVADLVFLFSRFDHPERQESFPSTVNADTFRLGCTPVVNLFPQTAEPIGVDGTRHQYPVVPDLNQRDTLEIFSIDDVVATHRRTLGTRKFPPLFSWRHDAESGGTFWVARQRQSAQGGPATTMLSFADLNGEATTPDAETVTVHCTCSNGNLPSRLLFGQDKERGDFEKEGSTIKTIATVRRPGAPLRPPARSGRLWRLVSHLSLNYLSLVSEGRGALQEMLRLYDISGSPFLENHIRSISALETSPHFARVASPHGVVFARGMRVRMELNEELFSGGGAWLFAAVLDRFLGQYVSMNSFSQLVVTTPKRRQPLYQWEARAGARMLL
jgi:type VI secretion system protein ImpG